MKVGDLCTCAFQEGLCVYLGDAIFKGWYRIFIISTGRISAHQKKDLKTVKKCP